MPRSEPIYPDAVDAQKVKGSIRWKLLTTMMGLIVGLVVTLTSIELLLQKRFLNLELDRRVGLIRENLMERSGTLANVIQPQIENYIATLNFSQISDTLNKAIEESNLLHYAVLMNDEGVIYIHSEESEAHQAQLLGEPAKFALAQKQMITHEYPNLHAIEYIQPIFFGQKQWGVLRLGFSTQELQREVARSKDETEAQITRMILTTSVIASFFIMLGSAIVLLIATTLSRPLIRLTASVRELARGNFDGVARIMDSPDGRHLGHDQSDGEIGLLAASFMDMAWEIHGSHQKLEEYNRTLEEKVRLRTQELEQANEKLKELDQLKTNFLSTVSHELRTPLTSVLGFARIIQKRFDTVLLPALSQSTDKKIEKAIHQVMENTRIIVEEGERLTTLINDVLDLAKMEAGRTDWNMQLLQIEDVVDRAMMSTASLFVDKPVEFVKEQLNPIPDITGDRDRLIQVVINLISNAVKFTEEGKVTCRIEQHGQEVVVAVSDSGCGIKPEDQKLVFEKFKQVGDTLTDKPKGTGLGLPICKEIVEYHGGRIWVESEPLVGSTFLFSIPVSRKEVNQDEFLTSYEGVEFVRRVNDEDLIRRLSARIARRAVRDLPAARQILIIDDDPNIRHLLREELATAGYVVHESESGVRAMEWIQNNCPDLVVLDLYMPQIGGFAVAGQLRADPVTCDLPIVVHSVADEKRLSERLGLDAYVTKVVNSSVLLEEIRKLLKRPEYETAKRILLIDDHKDRRVSLAELLSKAGFFVEQIADDATLRDRIESFNPHLLLIDSKLANRLDLNKEIKSDKNRAQLFIALLENHTS